MEHLKILETINDNIIDTCDNDKSLFIFAAAIYDTWSKGSEFEKNLADRLVHKWCDHLYSLMNFDYNDTKYYAHRSSYEDYCKAWVERKKDKFSGHQGIVNALKQF